MGPTTRDADLPGAPPRVVVMGVSGCGKSTVGALLAARLGVPFIDGDSLHPPANLALMAAGTPLTDEDRWPWLRAVGAALASAPHGAVVACSALRRGYRDVLRQSAPGAFHVHLDGPRALLERRLTARSGHFMPATLLDSQLATLEHLDPDEAGVTLGLELTPGELAARAAAALGAA